MRARAWERRVRPHFDFLTEHGFALERDASRSEWYATSVAYVSDDRAVVVTHSIEFDRVEVEIARLVGGEIPRGPVFFSEDGPLDNTLLDNVLAARAPERLDEAGAASGLGRRDVARQLAMWAAILRDVVPDFLAGETSAIDEAREVIRERVRRNPQQVKVWLPDDAGPEDEARAVANARKAVPPNVEVSSRRYRRR